MKNKNTRQLVLANMALWLMAAFIYPIAHSIPTGSGDPPKIFGLFIPLFVLAMGLVSTNFIRVALGKDA